MSEELLQRNLIHKPEKIGTWNFYNIGSTSINDLKEANIIRSIDYDDVSRKKVDGIITRQKEVIAIIEYKSPKQFNTQDKKNKAILQEIEVAKKLKTKLIIATDTHETLWINVATGNSIRDKNGNDFKYPFNPQDENLQKVITEIIQSINDKNDRILPKNLVDPSNLAKQIWQDIWSTTGATPENCLYTFVELFIFKYLSDLNILQGTHSFYSLIKMYKEENESSDVIQHYAEIIRPRIKKLFPENQEDRTTIINGTIFVDKDQEALSSHSTLFQKVLTKFEKYGKLEHIDHDFKSKLFESFLKESISKKNWGQFFTPIKVVQAINEMASGELKDGMIICDPACGVGKFPLEFVKDNLNELFVLKNGKIQSKVKIVGFDKGFDKDEQKTIILAKANMLIYFSELIKDNPEHTEQFAQLFNESFILKTHSILGTLSEPVENEYDLILTNPPYVTSGSRNLKEEITRNSQLKNYYKINGMGVEGLFMEWIVKSLKPNGKAFVVVPDGILNRQNDKKLRQFILDNCFIDAIISLPEKTFFTTPKKTYILAVTKKSDIAQVQSDPVFTYICSEIGESRDIYRFDIDHDDLKEAISLFNAFKGSRKYFAHINHDKRCKLQSIDAFTHNHWSIDRWINEKEKIELGIVENTNPISINEFSNIVYEMSQEFLKFSSRLRNIDTHNANISYKEIALSNTSIFEIFIGKRIVKKEIRDIKNAVIPIYSANVYKPIGFTNKSNISNFTNNFVLWGIDGNFNFNYIQKGSEFCTTDHCGAIRILNSEILAEYLMIELERVKNMYGFDRGLRASLKNIKKISVQFPINREGTFDIMKQKEIVDKFQVILEIKHRIYEYQEQIEKLKINGYFSKL